MTASALAQVNTVILIRLGIACYVTVPLAAVSVVSLTPIIAGTATSPVYPAEGSNTGVGTCSQVLVAQRLLHLSGSLYLRAMRRALADQAPLVSVAIAVTLLNVTEAQHANVLRVLTLLKQLLQNNAAAQLQVAATVGSTFSSNVTGSTAIMTLLGAALHAGATASGANYSQVSVGGSDTSILVASSAVPMSPSGSAATSGLPAGAIAAIAIVLVVALAAVVVGFLVYYRITSKGVAKPVSGDARGAAEVSQTNDQQMMNPMRAALKVSAGST